MSHTIVGVFGGSVEPVLELLLLFGVQIAVVTTASVWQSFEPLGAKAHTLWLKKFQIK